MPEIKGVFPGIIKAKVQVIAHQIKGLSGTGRCLEYFNGFLICHNGNCVSLKIENFDECEGVES